MNYNNPRPQQTAGIIRYSCSLLFLAFTFCYVFFIQGELLAQAQYVFSHGITHYSNPVGAVLIAAVLQLVQWITAHITRLPARFHAVSYFPSFLALAVLTDLSREHILHASWHPWNWLAPLLFLLFVVLVFALKVYDRNHSSSLRQYMVAQLWPNCLALFLMILFCGISNSADDVFLYELKAERLILEGRYEEAAKVGILAEATSPRLNNLRHYALSRIGKGHLPENIFLYPQPYGTEGLLVLCDTAKSQERITLTDITARLGAHTADVGMPAEKFISLAIFMQQAHLDSLLAVDSLTLATAPDSVRVQHDEAVKALRREIPLTADYYLCSLLLEKDLPQFLDVLPEFYPQVYENSEEEMTSLPLSFREALAIAAPEWCDSLTLQRYQSYTALRDSLTTPASRRNLTLYEYGRNYWWYYDFQQ